MQVELIAATALRVPVAEGVTQGEGAVAYALLSDEPPVALLRRHADDLADARADMLEHASAGLGLNHSDWRQVTRGHADFDSLDPAPRFFLFTVKALGYLHARLGRQEEGRALLEKVAELDPADRIGVRPLLAVLDRRANDREDDES
mgnify:CR=1 FL=1